MGVHEIETEDEFKVPINLLWDKLLMLSIVGILDSRKTQIVMEEMLSRINEIQAKIIIMDIMGVLAVDSAVANHIIKITKATRLMGCECILSGISPAISQTIVNLGIELEGITTTSTLKDALELSFQKLGLELKML